MLGWVDANGVWGLMAELLGMGALGLGTPGIPPPGSSLGVGEKGFFGGPNGCVMAQLLGLWV